MKNTGYIWQCNLHKVNTVLREKCINNNFKQKYEKQNFAEDKSQKTSSL